MEPGVAHLVDGGRASPLALNQPPGSSTSARKECGDLFLWTCGRAGVPQDALLAILRWRCLNAWMHRASPLLYVQTALGVAITVFLGAAALHAGRAVFGCVAIADGVIIAAVGLAVLGDYRGTSQAAAAYFRTISPLVRLRARWARLFPRLWGGGALLIGLGWVAGGVSSLLQT